MMVMPYWPVQLLGLTRMYTHLATVTRMFVLCLIGPNIMHNPIQPKACTSRACMKCRFTLAVEGTNLQAVMATLGAQGVKTTSNDIMEICKYLGIEAARHVIMSEIKEVMRAYGMTIDVRHTMLMADCMTSKVSGSALHHTPRTRPATPTLPSVNPCNCDMTCMTASEAYYVCWWL